MMPAKVHGASPFTHGGTYLMVGDIDAVVSGLSDAPQLGDTRLIDTGDRSVVDAVFRNGWLYVVATIDPKTGPDTGQATVHWWRLGADQGVSGLSLADQGDVGGEELGAATATFYPSVEVDACDNMAVAFCASSASMYLGAFFAGRLATDPAGTVRPAVALAQGLYRRRRGLGLVGRGECGCRFGPRAVGRFSISIRLFFASHPSITPRMGTHPARWNRAYGHPAWPASEPETMIRTRLWGEAHPMYTMMCLGHGENRNQRGKTRRPIGRRNLLPAVDGGPQPQAALAGTVSRMTTAGKWYPTASAWTMSCGSSPKSSWWHCIAFVLCLKAVGHSFPPPETVGEDLTGPHVESCDLLRGGGYHCRFRLPPIKPRSWPRVARNIPEANQGSA